MQVVERVLNMRSGYVLDFSDRTFDEFVAYEVGVDATAPRFSEDGGSKARRLRRILPSLSAASQAKLLRAFMEYRDSPTRALDKLDDEWREAFEKVIAKLEAMPVESVPPPAISSSAWTGRRSLREQVILVRELVPLAKAELEALADLIEARRFNDPVTADAVQCLRDLHAQLGDLLAAIDQGPVMKTVVTAIEANRKKLLTLMLEGAKVTVVAPAMTFGVMHLLAWLSGVSVDSTLASGVYASILGADALKAIGKKTTISVP